MQTWWHLTATGEVSCAYHDGLTFAKGGACPKCESDPPPDDHSEIVSQVPKADGLPAVVDHERWYVAISDRFRKEAESMLEDLKPQRKSKNREAQKARKANPLMAAKLADVAIKARRAAVEVTRWREDWEKTEQLEAELRLMRRGAK